MTSADDSRESTFSGGDHSSNDSLFSDSGEDDYYSFLGLGRNATPEEITNHYRKLSRIYHPDKHVEPEQKIKAEVLFGRTKRAYEVLSDPHKRAIYDSVGVKGLDTDGLEIVQKYKTPLEIREEYERLAKEREERFVERRTNPKGSLIVNVTATELFTKYAKDELDEYYDESGPYVEITGFHFTQSIEAPLTTKDTLTLGGNVSAENGRGKGQVTLGIRRNLSNQAWAEAEVAGTTNGLEFTFKGYSQLGQRYFTNFSFGVHSTNDGFKPALVIGAGTQLDNNSVGTITYRAGMMNGLQTSYVRDTSMSRFVASLHLGVPNTFGMCSYTHKGESHKLKSTVKVGAFGGYLEYAIEKKVSSITTFGATMLVGSPVGIALRLRISRSNQVYLFPIQLCDQILPAPLFYGTLAPFVLWMIAKKLFIDPYETEKQEREKEKARAAYKARMAEKKSEAEGAIELMRVMYNRLKIEEETRKGLIVLEATYGILRVKGQLEDGSYDVESNAEEVIDVTVPLQCLVKNSKLLFHENSKSQLPGFFDPAPGEEKILFVRYMFQNSLHEVLIRETERGGIPKQSHRLKPSS